MKSRTLLTALSMLIIVVPTFAKAAKLSLDEFLNIAIKRHPELESAHWREEAADAQLETSRAALLPSIEAGPLITRGEPGGSTVLALNGNLSSAMRSGQGVAGTVKYTAWDFGRTSSALKSGAADVEFARADSQRIKGELLLSLAAYYLECSKSRSQLQLLLSIEGEAIQIRDTIERLVRSGQRTEVEGHLSRAQALEVETQIQTAQGKVHFQELKLGTFIGRGSVSCLHIESLVASGQAFLGKLGVNPTIVLAQDRVIAAQERTNVARAEKNPKVQLLGNGGYFDAQKLNNPWNYSVSAAFVFPIWDGRTGGEIRKSEAAQRESEYELKTVQLQMNTLLISAKERYTIAKTQVASLEVENQEATRGFEIAKQRYKNSVGLLGELRETVRNLIRVSTALSSAKAELLSAQFLLRWYQGDRR